MSWLRRNADRFDDEPQAVPSPPPYVPASMRPRPDPAQAALEPDDPDIDDAQVRFLASLAERVEADASSAARRRGDALATSRPRRVDDDAVLSVFRDSAPEYDPYEGLRKLNIPDVEIADLVDELSTTAAALRRRRAA